MSSSQTIDDLRTQAIRILQRHLDRPATAHLKELAPIIVELRSRHTLADGRPDWGGRSADYRTLISEIYRRAGVPEHMVYNIQSALRYHVSNLLRERVPHDELAAVGLMTTSPKDRVRSAREALTAMKSTSIPRRDMGRIAAYARALLDYADDTVIPEMSDERAATAQQGLEEVVSRAEELMHLIKATHRDGPSTNGSHS